MKQHELFLRKVFYLAGMAALLYPLSYLGQPSAGRGEVPGGVLAQIRREQNLSYAELGEVDPASETLKLATLGFRCVAVDVLWEKAYRYQITEDWTNLSATLEQIARLQPHFINVWRFQGWNLSFNVSVEWDDYRDRYYWVIRGIRFLDDGQRYNQRDMRLYWDEGWFTGYKIGRSDEYRQFRRLFRNDQEFFAWFDPDWEVDRRDNWLVARESFLEAVDMVDNRGVPRKGIDPYLFFSEPAKTRIWYAEAIEEEGTFGQQAKRNWLLALDAWTHGRQSVQLDRRDVGFGSREFTTRSGYHFRVLDRKALEEEKDRIDQEFQAVTAGVREKILQEKMARLSPEERRLFEANPESLTPEQRQERQILAVSKLLVTREEIVQHTPEPKRQKAVELLRKWNILWEKLREIRTCYSVVNYAFWEERCRAESSDLGLQARELLFQAYQAYQQDPVQARKPYEKAFTTWRKLLDQYPLLKEDPGLLDDLIVHIRRYEDVLKRYDEAFPDDFVLREVLELRPPDPPIGNFGR